MKEINHVIQCLKEDKIRKWEEFPDIMLYMDQVLSLMEDQIFLKQNQVPLSASMVNNYVKSGLLPRAVKKKYQRGHLSRLSMISVLKQVISLKEMEVFFRDSLGDQEEYKNYWNKLQESKEEVLVEIQEMDEEEILLHLMLKSYLYKILAQELLSHED